MFGFRPRKTLTRQDVVWCFANIMGRHPRSTAEIDHFLGSCGDFRELVGKIAATPRDVRLERTDEVFPSPVDTPCYRGRADFALGAFRF